MKPAVRSPTPPPTPSRKGRGLSSPSPLAGEGRGEGVAHAHAERRRERTGSTPSAQGAVHLHIDRLALHGVTQADAPRLVTALKAELAALAAQPAHFAPLAANNLPSPRIATGRTPEHTGRAAAAAVWSRVAAPGEPR